MRRPVLRKPEWLGRGAFLPGATAGRRVVSAVLLAVVTVATIAGFAQVRIDTGIGSLLPTGDPAYEALEDKASSFGGDPVVVLLEAEEPRQLLVDQEKLVGLLRLEGALSRLPDVAAVYGPATVLNQTAASAQNVLARISGRRDALRNAAEEVARKAGGGPAEVEQAGKEAVAKFDRRYGPLLVKGLPAGLPTVRNPKFVTTVIYGPDDKPRPQWHFVVPTEKSVAVLVRPREGLDQNAAGELSRSVRSTVDDAGLGGKVTVTGVPVITSALTERAQGEAGILGAVAIAAVGAVFLLVPWSARRRARLRPLACALTGTAVVLAGFGWLGHPVSLGVVAFLPILLGIGSDFPFYLAQPGRGRRALVAAGAATAGFASLAVSPLPFVRELGLALAAGIVCTVGVAVVLRRIWGVVPPEPESAAAEPAAPGRAPRWQRVAALGAALAVGAVGGAALPVLDIEARPDRLAEGLPELARAKEVERTLGSAGEVSIVLRGKDVLSPEAFRWMRQAEQVLISEHGDQLRPIVTVASLLRFLGAEPTAQQINAAMELLPSYLTTAVVQRGSESALMVFGVRLQDLDRQRALLQDVRAALPPPPSGFHVDIVGLPVVAVRGLDLVSGSRVAMNVLGVLAAGLVLLVGLRRRADAARAVLTVVLATGWVWMLTWAAVGSLSPLTVAIGSLTTATGCEFAVLLSHRGDRRRTARAVATAALAGTLGYAVLALSGLAVLREFGLLLAAGVVCSYLAARAVHWALPPRSDAPAAGTARSVVPTRKEVAV